MFSRLASSLALCCCLTSVAARSQSGMAHTAGGLELSSAALTLRVDALRSDVLRVRVYPSADLRKMPPGQFCQRSHSSHALSRQRLTGSAPLPARQGLARICV